MNYRPDFITDMPASTSPTLRSTPEDVKLRRLVDDLNPADEGFPYSRTLYESSPLGRSLERGMPGRLFAIGGQFTWRTHHNLSTDGLFIVEMLFPSSDGFEKKIVTERNGRKKVTVSDGRGNQVAVYIRSPGRRRNGDGRRQYQNDRRQKDFRSVGTFGGHRLPEHLGR